MHVRTLKGGLLKESLMQKLLLFFLAVLLAACAAPDTPVLKEGTWTGHLTPMNHPEMQIPLTYYVAPGPTLSIAPADGEPVAVRNLRAETDTLFFIFDEPDAGVPLACRLAHRPDGAYAGRCTDADGKWAVFTMIPPD